MSIDISDSDNKGDINDNVALNPGDDMQCLNCGFKMHNITACHLQCANCGAEQDCSDKGSIW